VGANVSRPSKTFVSPFTTGSLSNEQWLVERHGLPRSTPGAPRSARRRSGGVNTINSSVQEIRDGTDSINSRERHGFKPQRLYFGSQRCAHS
jgi:hypothetical protein